MPTKELSVKIRSAGKRTSARNRRGGTLIEFTLALPILLATMTGLTSFGFALHNDVVLTNAVNSGAQVLSFSRGQTTDPCATAYTAITTAAPNLSTSSLSLTFVINGTTYSATTSCPAATSNMVASASAQVIATYPCTLAVFGEKFSACSLKTQVTELIQ